MPWLNLSHHSMGGEMLYQTAVFCSSPDGVLSWKKSVVGGGRRRMEGRREAMFSFPSAVWLSSELHTPCINALSTVSDILCRLTGGRRRAAAGRVDRTHRLGRQVRSMGHSARAMVVDMCEDWRRRGGDIGCRVECPRARHRCWRGTRQVVVRVKCHMYISKCKYICNHENRCNIILKCLHTCMVCMSIYVSVE